MRNILFAILTSLKFTWICFFGMQTDTGHREMKKIVKKMWRNTLLLLLLPFCGCITTINIRAIVPTKIIYKKDTVFIYPVKPLTKQADTIFK